VRAVRTLEGAPGASRHHELSAARAAAACACSSSFLRGRKKREDASGQSASASGVAGWFWPSAERQKWCPLMGGGLLLLPEGVGSGTRQSTPASRELPQRPARAAAPAGRCPPPRRPSHLRWPSVRSRLLGAVTMLLVCVSTAAGAVGCGARAAARTLSRAPPHAEGGARRGESARAGAGRVIGAMRNKKTR
jgi:hypothetical protein